MYKLVKEFGFEAAHYLPGHEKCGKMHGHSYKVRVELTSPVNGGDGMLIDFGEISSVRDQLDHSLLNETIALPTAENISHWIWERLAERIIARAIGSCNLAVTVWETDSASITYSSAITKENTRSTQQ